MSAGARPDFACIPESRQFCLRTWLRFANGFSSLGPYPALAPRQTSPELNDE
jgi:hypothetical protein